MNKIKARLTGEIISTNEADAFALYKKSSFGQPTGQKIQYSLSEALYLLEKNKIEILQNNKILKFNELLNKFKRIDSRIQLKYPVFRDLRDKGYVVKTALKFGADFRVYEKGKTSFGQKIRGGVVSNIHDGSIDELLSSKYIIQGKRRVKGPYARSVIVIETNTIGIPLSKRVKIHSRILKRIREFYRIANSIYDDPYLRRQIESDIV